MAAQQQSQGGGDNSLAPLWYAAGIVLVVLAAWYFAHAQIVAFVLAVRLLEVQLMAMFVHVLAPVEAMLRSISPVEYSNITFDQLVNISTAVGSYFRYPVIGILLILALVLYLSNPILRFKKTYSMQRLVDDEKENWPQITPILGLDLVSEDIDKGPWAMAMSPMQFAKKYRLLMEERGNPVTSFTRKGRAAVTAVVIREEAHKVFAFQLGSFWTNVDSLKVHAQALFAVFAARLAGDREGAAKLLQHIALSASSGKLDFSGYKELLNKYRNNKHVVRATEDHAYVLTVMASMLMLARRDGVLATADFLWLKPLDRTLWYMLNAVGRQTPYVEVAGPFAHWLAELEFGRKLYVPVVDAAVNALEIAIKEVVYVSEEEEQMG